jgi:putative ABC transport system substrate-binding protein
MKSSKLIIIIAAACIVLGACKKNNSAPGTTPDGAVKIGISKTVQHSALDAVERGIVDAINNADVNAVFNLQNANGDVNTASQIASIFKNEKVALAIGIGTPVSVALANTIKDTPVVFSTVTDPLIAGLVDTLAHGKNNVTGMSDAVRAAPQIALFKEIAGIKTLGFIYTSNEANSISTLAEVKAACAEQGIELVEQSISVSSDVRQAAEAIIGRIDGIYLSTDNTIYSALPSLIEVCKREKKPLFSADVTSIIDAGGGAVIAQGFSYYKAGLATGEIALKILGGEAPDTIPVRFLTEPDEFELLFDLDEAAACGITIPKNRLAEAKYIISNGKLTTKE